MRWFETRGPVYPEDNYVVARTEELGDFVNRLKKGQIYRPFCAAPDRQDNLLPKCPRRT